MMDLKRSRKVISVEIKQKIIRKSECGAKQCDLAKEFGLNKTTICCILGNKDAIKSAKVAKGVSKLFNPKHRSVLHEQMERLLTVWIDNRRLKGDIPTQDAICCKAKIIFDDVKKNAPATSCTKIEEEFKASRGWFFRFKKRCGIHSTTVPTQHAETSRVKNIEAEKFSASFQQDIMDEEYSPQQVFTAKETCLFWKRMPSRTFIAKEEQKLPEHKSMNDKLTLLFSSNASGDFKIKPLLVYHSENPSVFKNNSIVKSKLPIHWKSNEKAQVTQVLFKEWILEIFAPAVQNYLLEKELPLKALLVLDNAAFHPKDLEKTLEESYYFIKVQYLPPNTSSNLLPINQEVIANFKRLYTRALFNKVFQECEFGGAVTVRKYWKEKFDILIAIRLIHKAWGAVPHSTLNLAWKALVPYWTQEEAVEDIKVMEDIILMAQQMELEVEEEDVEELIKEHQEELTTEDLQELLVQQCDENQRKASSDEEEQSKQVLSTAAIKDFLSKWGEVQAFTNTHYPNTAEVNRINELYNETLAGYFRQVLKKTRENRITLERFFKKQRLQCAPVDALKSELD